METNSDFNSIRDFLPPLKHHSGGLIWPNEQVTEILTFISNGGVNSGFRFFATISRLRRALNLQDSLASSTKQGITLFFDELISSKVSEKWFDSVLPCMGILLLTFPSLLTYHYQDCVGNALRLLKSQEPGMVVLRQDLVAALLCCSLFCLFPTSIREANKLQPINMDALFGIGSATSFNNISFERKVISLPSHDLWTNSEVPLCDFNVVKEGKIERDIDPFVEVIFSDQNLGGQVLSKWCTQEEVRFLIYPEMMAGMLFLAAMSENEAIEIVGAERFSKHEGLNADFRYVGNYVDKTVMFSIGRRMCRMVTIDAIRSAGTRQYELENLLREVNKAYCGFLDHPSRQLRAESGFGIVTGNWGCAFGGDPEIKSMIQWLAASQASRLSLTYFSFGFEKLRYLDQVVDMIKSDAWTVGYLWKRLVEYCSKRSTGGFFAFLLSFEK